MNIPISLSSQPQFPDSIPSASLETRRQQVMWFNKVSYLGPTAEQNLIVLNTELDNQHSFLPSSLPPSLPAFLLAHKASMPGTEEYQGSTSHTWSST